jgi:hypothetical protein
MGCCPGKTPPPLRTQAKSALKAAGRVVRALAGNRDVMASDEVVAARLAICRGCEFVITHPTSDFLRCADCGCGLNGRVKFKAKLATEDCRFWRGQ